MQDENEREETDAPLTVAPGTVCFIVEKAWDMQGKTARSGDAGPDDDDDPRAEILEEGHADPVEAEITAVISDLNDDAQADLVALMWLGRGDGSWRELRDLAAQEHTDATAQYLCGTPLLADYLLAGLAALGLDCNEWLRESG